MGYWKQRKLRKMIIRLTYLQAKATALHNISTRFSSGSSNILETYAHTCGTIAALEKEIELIRFEDKIKI